MSINSDIDHYTDDEKYEDTSDDSTESGYAVEQPECVRKAKQKGGFAILVDISDEEEEKYDIELLESSASEDEQWSAVFGYYKDQLIMLMSDDEYDQHCIDQQECKQTEDMVKIARDGLVKRGWRSPDELRTASPRPTLGSTHGHDRYNRYECWDGRKRILALLLVVAVLLVIAVIIYIMD